MSKEAENEGYFLVAKRADPKTGTPHEIWARRGMTDAQVEEMFRLSCASAKMKSPDYAKDAIKVWVDDAFFESPGQEPIQPPQTTRGK